MIIIMKNCNDFQVHRCIECMRELEAAKDQGSSRLQTSQITYKYADAKLMLLLILRKAHAFRYNYALRELGFI